MGEIRPKGVELFAEIQEHSVLDELELCKDFALISLVLIIICHSGEDLAGLGC